MKRKKIILMAFALLILAVILFLYINRDKFTYVGQIELVEVDCNKKGEILDSVYQSDQRIRMSNVPFEQFAKEDHRNQELAISIIEKCGMPSLKEVSRKQLDAIWLALQHTDKKYRKKYFPLIEEAVKKGDLSKQQYALMKDRILMDDGKPQLYGSQIKNGKLYELEAPDSVNERRKEMELEPLEEYLKNFNIEYKPN
ncbi:MAG: hypothetical protein IPK35_01590 [Saprospiraceae bacterium]|jgi:hypothetical protein|nr:hypothetical protein [Saprospiraceae bacterium]